MMIWSPHSNRAEHGHRRLCPPAQHACSTEDSFRNQLTIREPDYLVKLA